MKKKILVISLLVLGVLLCACKANGPVQIYAYLDSDLPEFEQRAVVSKIQQVPGVLETEYISAAEALEEFVDHHQDKAAFSGVDASDLCGRVVVTVSAPAADSVAAQIEKIEGVAEVSAGNT